MNRQEKDHLVSEIKDLLGGVQAVILTRYAGTTVASMVELRTELKKVNAGYRVMKNTLASLAMSESDLSVLAPHLSGQTGVAFTHEDPAAAAKVVSEFAKKHPAFEVTAGYLEGGVLLDPAGVDALSKLPSRDQLRGMLLSTFGGVPRMFVSLLAAPGRNLVGVLDARRRELAGE